MQYSVVYLPPPLPPWGEAASLSQWSAQDSVLARSGGHSKLSASGTGEGERWGGSEELMSLMDRTTTESWEDRTTAVSVGRVVGTLTAGSCTSTVSFRNGGWTYGHDLAQSLGLWLHCLSTASWKAVLSSTIVRLWSRFWETAVCRSIREVFMMDSWWLTSSRRLFNILLALVRASWACRESLCRFGLKRVFQGGN